MKNLVYLLLLLSTFPIFSRTAVSGQQQVKNIFYIIDEKSNLQVEDDSDGLGKNAINEIIKNGTQIKDEFRFSPGFVNGTLWVLLQKNSDFTDATNSQNFQILDLGPELVDRAELFVFCGEKWQKADSTGRQVKNSEKSIKSWRSFVQIPEQNAGDEFFVLKIKSSDSISLVFRFFELSTFFAQTEKFSFIHIIFVGLMFLAFFTLLLFFVSSKEKLFLYLSLMSLCFCLYQAAMKGLGCTYIWNRSCDCLFFSRFSYVVCCIGLLFSQILFLQNISFNKNGIFYKSILRILSATCLVSVALYAFVRNIKISYITTICFLIFGCLFCSVIMFLSAIRKKSIPVLLICSWIPLFVYIVFRQSLHLLRLKYNVNSYLAIFDNDYYFGYDICFIFHIFIYSLSIFIKLRQKNLEFNMYRESSYFLKASAHELLAPITLIQNSFEELERQNTHGKPGEKGASGGGSRHQQNPEQIFAYLKSVKGNISRLKNIALMVNSLEEQEQDIQKVSRLCKPIRIMQIFQQVMDNFIPYSEFKGIEINYFSSCSEKTCVSVFPLFLETVFTNLIDNAVKYSVENGKISINIEYNEQKNELVYQVSNFSENILGQNLETLFSLGARGKNAAENIRGLGIGLHLVRRICRLYNGSCSAFCIPLENPLENKLENLGGNLPKNKNSTELCKVVFEARLALLPYSPETSELLKNDRANGYNKILSEKKSLKNDAQESELKNLMQNNLILIVEDNIALLKNIAELLKPYCPVITATNGKDAICKIKKNTPDLIISDMVMPVMGGKAFFDFCRGDENLKNVPFLFLTGVQDVALKNSFIKQGVVDYIFKPFSQEELLLKIYSILSLCVNVRKDFARTITDFVNKSTASGMHRGISFMEKEPEENHISQKEKRHEYYKTFNLSKREVEISELLYENHSNKEIAETLFIAVSTVATHIQHIYEKCGVRNRNEWIRLMSGG